MADTSTQWQLARDAAERYEQILVPAVLGPFAEALVEYAAPQSGDSILDVGCGTGAAARFASERVKPDGRTFAVDVNAAMIDVARSLPSPGGSSIEWHEQSAYDLQFQAGTFDLVICAQTLQFLDDRAKALREMQRVLKPGARVALSVWSDITGSPYFDALVDAVSNHIGPGVAQGLRAAFSLSDSAVVHAGLLDAGFTGIESDLHRIEIKLPPLEHFIPRHVSATPMAAGFAAAEDSQRQAVIQEVGERLAPLSDADGGARVPFRTHLIRALRPT